MMAAPRDPAQPGTFLNGMATALSDGRMRTSLILVLLGLLGLSALFWTMDTLNDRELTEPIRVGILLAASGPQALHDQPIIDATRLALEEINRQGGLLGQPVEVVMADTRSDDERALRETHRLIEREKVRVVFGCGSSTCRKRVTPVFETHHHLLIHPHDHEGLEESQHLIHTGGIPNQRVLPAIIWSLRYLGDRFFLVGSDSLYSRAVNEIIRQQIKALRRKIVGHANLPPGEKNFKPIIEEIRQQRPAVVLNTIGPNDAGPFFQAFQSAEPGPGTIPILSFNLGENDIRRIGAQWLAGHYVGGDYFQSIDTEANRIFIKRFQDRFGTDRPVDNAMMAAHMGVHLWAKAIRETLDADPETIRKQLGELSMASPGGILYLDRKNRHTWKIARIGRIDDNGRIRVVWSSGRPIPPRPFPGFIHPSQWTDFLQGLHRDWRGAWTCPPPCRPGAGKS